MGGSATWKRARQWTDRQGAFHFAGWYVLWSECEEIAPGMVFVRSESMQVPNRERKTLPRGRCRKPAKNATKSGILRYWRAVSVRTGRRNECRSILG